MKRDQIVVFERVRLSGKASTIRYELKPVGLEGGEPQVRVSSVHIGRLPVPALRELLWNRSSTELSKALSPGIQNLKLERLDNGNVELSMRPTGAAPASLQ